MEQNNKQTMPCFELGYLYVFKEEDEDGELTPVCRGNDGIPFDVDSLTISFPKWRQESIKAYGNAWVPQVAYEIFRAIEAEENK